MTWWASGGLLGMQVLIFVTLVVLVVYVLRRLNTFVVVQEERREAEIREVKKEAERLAARATELAKQLKEETILRAEEAAATLDHRMGELVTRLDGAKDVADSTHKIVTDELTPSVSEKHPTTREQIERIQETTQDIQEKLESD